MNKSRKKRTDWFQSKDREPKGWKVNTYRILLIMVILAVWELGVTVGWIDAFFWSLPSDIFAKWLQVATNGSIWVDTFYTFRATVFGFIIGTTAGAIIGLSFWWSKFYAKLFEPLVIMIEGMPKLALAPMVVLLFGLGLSSKVVMAVALTIVVTTLTTYNGSKQVDKDLIRMIYSLGGTRWQVFKKVVVPWTMPAIISALRINIGLALTGAIVGEYIGSKFGLGKMIFYAGQTYDISLIWAGILNLSILSMILYLIVGKIEGYLLKGMLHQK